MHSRTTVAIVSPWPTNMSDGAQSGVARYLVEILEHTAADLNVWVVAQRGCDRRPLSRNVHVVASWKPGISAVIGVLRALRQIRPDVIHIQHEFRIFGGVLSTVLVLAGVTIRGRTVPLVTTLHGVVERRHVSGRLLSLPDLAIVRRAACLLLSMTYRLLGRVSEELVVTHSALQVALTRDYGTDSRVIMLGSRVHSTSCTAPRTLYRECRVMIFGFLASYKRPELVLDLAETQLLPEATFVVSVAKNPRIQNRAYEARHAALRRRALALPDRVEWYEYLPDEQLTHLLTTASTLVLPYTDLVSVSAVGGLALGSGLPLCYSIHLAPLFGEGPTMFDMTPTSLSAAIRASADPDQQPMRIPFLPWEVVYREHENLWKRVSR